MGLKDRDKSQTSRGEEKCMGTVHKTVPNADKTQFSEETSVDEKYNIRAGVFFNEGPGSSVGVIDSHRKYWSQ